MTNKTPYYISDKLNQACKEYNRFYEMSEKSNHQDISTNIYQALSKFCKNASTSIKSRMNCNGWGF